MRIVPHLHFVYDEVHKAWGNPLGYSGTNSKYVRISDSKWFNNGAGIVPNTLDSEKFEPTGDLILENNDIFWNNYNYYQPDSGFNNVIGNGNPIGVGIMLYGADGVISRNNNIFGHEKWGTASFSGPEIFGVNVGDDAMNMNNQFSHGTTPPCCRHGRRRSHTHLPFGAGSQVVHGCRQLVS